MFIVKPLKLILTIVLMVPSNQLIRGQQQPEYTYPKFPSNLVATVNPTKFRPAEQIDTPNLLSFSIFVPILPVEDIQIVMPYSLPGYTGDIGENTSDSLVCWL